MTIIAIAIVGRVITIEIAMKKRRKELIVIHRFWRSSGEFRRTEKYWKIQPISKIHILFYLEQQRVTTIAFGLFGWAITIERVESNEEKKERGNSKS